MPFARYPSLHDRVVFALSQDGTRWTKTRLYP